VQINPIKEHFMNRITTCISTAACAALLTFGGSAFAQQSGLVNVEVSNVANDIARNLSVDVSQIPVTVQAPIGVAANVCGVAANVLGKQAAGGGGSCTATSTNTALNQIVQKQLKKG
jgi:hypothetical protein